VQSGYNGAGKTVAVIIDSDVTRSDVSAFFSYFQTPYIPSRTITTETLDGGVAGTPGSGIDEVTLDVETIGGLAPGANIIIYDIGALQTSDVNDAVNEIISDGTAQVVSMSVGGCENSYSYNTQAGVFATGASDGITFVASSGDQGNDCYGEVGLNGGGYRAGVTYPASDPNVIGVGGNESDSSAGLTSTAAWNETITLEDMSMVQVASGGGTSNYFYQPSYQTGVAGEYSTVYRNVPDVAMPASNVAVYESGSWGADVGTSWSAPQMAAMFAELDQYCQANLGAPHTLLYNAFSTASSDFIDVVSGNNQYGITTPFYTAGTGYDNVTGLGMPKAMSLAATICPNRTLVASRRGSAAAAVAFPQHAAQAYTSNALPEGITPLRDLGARSSAAPTSIQLILTPAAAKAGSDSHVIGVLQSAGFTITRTFSNHLIVDAQGTPAQIASLFATTLHDYAQTGYGTRYAPAGPYTVPAGLAPYLSGVILDNVVTMRSPRSLRTALTHRGSASVKRVPEGRR
jgi:subtilase family serine protease